jgi:hypothetical protein
MPKVQALFPGANVGAADCDIASNRFFTKPVEKFGISSPNRPKIKGGREGCSILAVHIPPCAEGPSVSGSLRCKWPETFAQVSTYRVTIRFWKTSVSAMGIYPKPLKKKTSWDLFDRPDGLGVST